MTDKERILMLIVARIIPGLACSGLSGREQYIELGGFSNPKLEKGDLVFASTTISPNDFMVGFVDSIEPTHVVIREIGSDRLCNYSNESFPKINKERLGYEILEGVQYQIYQKTCKAFGKYTKYSTRFKSISFDGKLCTVEARMMFSEEKLFCATFPFTSKTSIREIGKILAEAETEQVEEDTPCTTSTETI